MKIPHAILQGCCAMLATYVPKLTPEQLESCIKASSTPSPVPQSGGNYLTSKQLCGMLHLSQPTLWRHVKAGRLKARKVGARTLYKESDVRGLVEGGAEA